MNLRAWFIDEKVRIELKRITDRKVENNVEGRRRGNRFYTFLINCFDDFNNVNDFFAGSDVRRLDMDNHGDSIDR